ncbi:hypothetical protein [Phytoactinopolyspora halotolerans]|uniref:Transporter n=1 Tax=Phytoactinopolyspora halotolerans TaxID=1981512 RepID=A0A6L9S4V3_9ACTN|nr:hypothetical protein [Phytoactinopolyspora halotolerans]NEE00067.1 hypothetical protein [Phytoactinopolyspora halotolerans]
MAADIPGLSRTRRDGGSPGAGPPGIAEIIRLFVALKLRLIGNSLKGSNARLVAGLIGAAAGVGAIGTGIYVTVQLRHADAADARLALILGGSLVVLAWFVLPVLIFGIDESIDPRRFILLPLPRRALLAGMLAAGFVGIPAAATLTVSLATLVTWARGILPVLYALPAAALTALLCVVASRTVTTALAGAFRSRRMRDLVSMAGMLVVVAALALQLSFTSMAQLASRDTMETIGDVLAWTPLGATWAAPYDAATGSAALGLARLLVAAATVGAMVAVWERTLRSSLENGGSPARTGRRASRKLGDAAPAKPAPADPAPADPAPGDVAPVGGVSLTSQVSPADQVSSGARVPGPAARRRLTPAWAGIVLRDTVTGAVAARVLHLWWRDPRQRVSLLIVPLLLFALIIGPVAFDLRNEALVLAVPGVGTLIGLLMLNHTAFDGTALWSHLAVALPGQVDRAGRALGTAVWAIPVIVLASIALCAVIGRPDLVPAAIGSSVSTVLVGLAFGSVSSVVIAFPAPPASANPFTTPSGGNVVVVLQQFAGGLIVGMLSLPVYVVLGLATWWRLELGWVLLVLGPAYGLVLLHVGNRLGGRYLDRNGPELLRRITPVRT